MSQTVHGSTMYVCLGSDQGTSDNRYFYTMKQYFYFLGCVTYWCVLFHCSNKVKNEGNTRRFLFTFGLKWASMRRPTIKWQHRCQRQLQLMMLACVPSALKSLKLRDIYHVNIHFATSVYLLILSVSANLRSLVWDFIALYVGSIFRVTVFLANLMIGRGFCR